MAAQGQLSILYVAVRKRQVAILARSYREMSQTVRIDCWSSLSRVSIWSILTKRRQMRFSGGLRQSNATMKRFEGLEGFMEVFGHLNSNNLKFDKCYKLDVATA